jgi:hypothetical protein
MKNMWIPLSIVLGIASSAMAQDVVPMRTQDPAARQAAEKMAAAQREQKVVGEMRARVAVEARITTGAPYFGEAVTESTQVLADGNRISRKSVTRVYRDGEGRTRREEVDEAGTVVSVSIVDPVAHVSYVLEPATRTAYRKNAIIEMPAMIKQKVEAAVKERTAVPPPPPPAPPAGAIRQTPPPPPPPPDARITAQRIAPGAMAREDLGQQNIEGVNATGTRTTNTIAAGAIGNLQPIKVVSEQWFSPDLQLLVMTKHSDPRTGDTIYRLQGIVRAEPDRSLFTLPADYTLRESGIRQPQQP